MKTNKQTFRFCLLALASGFFIMVSSCTADQIEVQDETQNKTVVTDIEARPSGPSVNGQGTVSLENTPLAGEGFRHFSFHANTKKDGSVKGSGVLTYTGGAQKIKFSINCLSVDGNHAILSGVTTSNTQTPANEGLLFWFEVFDNGEGNNAAPDQLSLYYQGSDPVTYDCSNDFEVELYEIEGGNIQVK